ncbi:MAG: SEC-C metal-binding domain-containing protein [Clostridia bacterium]|nr:SEC-C metal-binding domain-containing protein [Clostridia bacterium]
MSLYQEWTKQAQSFTTEKEYSEFWKAYFDKEKSNYIRILENHETVFSGKVEQLAADFGMTNLEFMGFLDGINTSLEDGELDLEALNEESVVALKVDFDKLYFNMLNAKANWLYELPEWDAIRTPEQRDEIRRSYRASKVFVAEKTAGRNDPCPCGSGKKYKKCCGK